MKIRYIKWMFLSFAMSLGVQLLALLPPLIMERILDLYLPQGDLQRIAGSVAVFALLPLLSSVGASWYVYVTAVKCREFSYELNGRILTALLHQDIQFHIDHTSAALAAKASQETKDYVYTRLCEIPSACSKAAVAIAVLLMVGRTSPWIACMQLVYVLLLIWPVKRLGQAVQDNSGRIFQAITRINATLNEAFRGIRAIKSAQLEDHIIGRYKAAFMDANQFFGRAVLLETTVGTGIGEFLSAMFLGITFVVCSLMVMNGGMTMGILVSTLSLLPRFYAAISALGRTDLSFRKQLGQHSELFSYMELTPESAGNRRPERFLQRSIALRDVSFIYPDGTKALEGLDLTIPRGQWFGIEGASGTGKSTLLQLLMLFYKPTCGEIALDDVPLKEIDLEWYRSHIACAAQEPFLFTGSIRDNFRCVRPDITDEEIWKALRFAALEAFVAALPEGLDTEAGENGSMISGGERQRLSLSIAVSRRCPLLILDEATSNLDVENERVIRDRLRMLADSGTTIVSVSHRPAFHERCDRLIHLPSTERRTT